MDFTRNIECNRAWYVAASGAIYTITMVLFLAVLIDFLLKPADMTVFHYRTGPIRLVRMSALVSLFAVLPVASVAWAVCMGNTAQKPQEILYLFCNVLSGAAIFTIGWLERHAGYHVIGGNADIPEDAVIIR